MSILEQLVTGSAEPAPVADVEAWWARHREVAARFDLPVDAAVAAGFAMDRVGWGFASGYQEAIGALFPLEGTPRPAALCATEPGGAHPRAIEARLSGTEAGELRLSGTKTYVTLGGFAQALFVLASEGEDDAGRRRLRVARIEANRRGVTLEPLGAAPFVPEVPHAAVRFDAVPLAPDEVLPGDGWERWVKPFRTVEDIHVHAALLGYLIQVARRSGWPPGRVEDALALVAALRTLALADPRAAATHRALAGALAAGDAFLASVEGCWPSVDEAARQRWRRDRPLLSVAAKARAGRLARARTDAPGR